MKEIILASASPRRMELMKMLGYDFKVIVSDAEEFFDDKKSIYENIENVAFAKANSVYLNNLNSIVIGADTIVYADNEILMKPVNKDDARAMMNRLSGRTHSVITGICVISSEHIVKENIETKVTFKKMDEEEIEEYINTDEPYDKAGGYGIQGLASKFISGICGDYFNVVGLSVSAVYDILKEFK